jgi:hypothetical protein
MHLKYFIALYGVTYDFLKEEMKFTLKDAVTKKFFKLLIKMGLTVEKMIKEGLTPAYFVTTRMGIQDWVSIGLNKNNALRIGLRGVHLEAIGWEPLLFIKALSLNPVDTKTFGILTHK